MRISYTFRNMDSSEGVKSYASEKISKIQKYMRAPLHSEVTFYTERHHHCVDITVTADGHRYSGHERSESMYASIDLAVDKIDRQVRNSKGAAKDRRRQSGDLTRDKDI